MIQRKYRADEYFGKTELIFNIFHKRKEPCHIVTIKIILDTIITHVVVIYRFDTQWFYINASNLPYANTYYDLDIQKMQKMRCIYIFEPILSQIIKSKFLSIFLITSLTAF